MAEQAEHGAEAGRGACPECQSTALKSKPERPDIANIEK